ncbi:MAG: secretin and TonB N-terminal domain-containing protein [Pseudanabaenaceae cyanobacterium SKYGB_i_bin29]|nr:secretin and TonB N-terminal domain-containing protein [Pseudanabaenaceae cyanobacterium SKYG29]MDW8420718.1 secretin and TonB N-terminal domain-containing protein [Pseudanabaenaceae cyanobacterium SKYGB_i_bin29]
MGRLPLALTIGTVVAFTCLARPLLANTIRKAQLKVTETALEVVLETQVTQLPRISTTQRGKNWVVEISDTALQLPEGNTFFRANPAPGISAVTILPLDDRTVQVIFTPTQPGNRVEVGQNLNGIVLKFPIAAAKNTDKGRLVPPAEPAVQPPEPPFTPFVPKAIVPPAGDIAISSLPFTPLRISLGSNERIPTLVLKSAPVEDVLSVLAMTVGLNTVFVETSEGDKKGVSTTVSMEVKNETVENVFNYILQVSNLQATRVGNTILIGKELPLSARGLVVKTVRLNQIKASLPEVRITSTTNSASSISSGGGTVGAGQTNVTTSQLSRTTTLQRQIPIKGAQQLLEALGANGGGTQPRTPQPQRPPAAQIFDGLQVTADNRTNSVTLIGTPNLVEAAIDYLKQVDVRSRQVSVNVKIVEVTLDDQENFGSSFSFGVDDSFFSNSQGLITGNFGNINPTFVPPVPAPDGSQGPSSLFSPPTINSTNVPQPGQPNTFQFPTKFLANLQARIRNNKAKILTDPTLIVQEGSASQVNLTTQVFAGLRTISETGPGNQPRTISDPREPIDVGVILNIAVEQIDDNGFITLSVSPEVSSPGEPIRGPDQVLIQQLVNRRRLDTGNIRLRDGQTLFLAGIIQEIDRQNVFKTPLLGDIPLIGSLFRSTTTAKERREVVVLITPKIID